MRVSGGLAQLRRALLAFGFRLFRILGVSKTVVLGVTGSIAAYRAADLCSAFRKEEDGTIRRVGHAPFGPGDEFCGVWHLFDLLEEGAAGWQPELGY